MTSPAQRYAAARTRNAFPELTRFQADFDFDFDPFQVEGCQSLERGSSVLVCAPTGSGKTVVGEFAVHLALTQGRKCFYTTPIKALSNQKFRDLGERFGAHNIGLMTGDTVLNADAPVIVMTTEVLRNMLYVGSTALTGLAHVVLDEVHYLGDRFRGAVWEEVIIHLPESVQVSALSATVSNAEEFGEWLATVRGDTDVVVHEQRPVPLWQHMLVGTRLFDLFAADKSTSASTSTLDPQLLRYINDRALRTESTVRGRPRQSARAPSGKSTPSAQHRRPGGWRPPAYPDVIERIDRDGLLPMIVFIFSRNGCDAAVRQCIAAGIRLTSTEEAAEIRAVAEARTRDLAADDLTALDYWGWLDGLQRGVAAHHAGLIPVFKETVEELFTRGLVQVVFATETLALGINMPARTVLLDRLRKFNGDTHVDVTPGEYTQLTGRAGRRGIDIEGHAVVLWGPQTDPAQVAGLASTRTYPLKSSFRPSYNMSVNLIAGIGRPAAREVLESSFAQFQADRSVVGVARQARSVENALGTARQAMQCTFGDFGEYAELRRRLKERETGVARTGRSQRRAAATAALEELRRGDVVEVLSGRRAGWAVVIDNPGSTMSEPRPLVVTADRWSGRLSVMDFPEPATVRGQLRIPKNFDHRSPQARRDLASALRELNLVGAAGHKRREGSGEDAETARLRSAVRSHPCHRCPDQAEHARHAERAIRLERELAGLHRRMEGRTHTLARTFDRICALLSARGLLDGADSSSADSSSADPSSADPLSADPLSADPLSADPSSGGTDAVTAWGRVLARIWGETDLLTTECLRHGVWTRLAPADLAAAVSCLVYEARGDDVREDPGDSALSASVAGMAAVWADLAAEEEQRGLPITRAPDTGFALATQRWARGSTLTRALERRGADPRTAGDFVRWCRQVIDLLEQIARAADDPHLTANARAAVQALRRGVVLS